MHKILKILSYSVFVLVFGWVCAQLFFQHETDQFLTSIFSEELDAGSQMRDLRVIYPDDALNLEPTSLYPATRQRLNNIYEPLVKFDRDLNVVPALALSWGIVDDLTWEFRLRPDVKFQDGSDFDMADVMSSFNRGENREGSELVNFVDSIDEVEPVDDLTFRIHTKNPDPILLAKLSNLFIIPSEYEEKELLMPIGTGPYRFVAWSQGELMSLESFEEYWAGEPQFDEVEVATIVDKSQRVNKFLSGEADFLAFVPFDAMKILGENNFSTKSIPSLEVQFLVFNQESEIFSNEENRQAVSFAVDQDGLVNVIGGAARPVNQFVSNGVFGFNPDLAKHKYDRKKATELSAAMNGKTVQFHLPIGLDVLGEQVRESLKEIGVNVVVSYLDTERLLESFEQGKADLYFLGFRAGTGDSEEFLWDTVHSSGQFNVGNYENSEVDDLIESSTKEMDPIKRLEMLQKIMSILDREFFGIPLFEYQTIFSFSDRLSFEPRIDGFLYFEDLIKK